MKEFKITEEQVKELAKGNSKVKKWFPEVFETKLEVGKWYKDLKSKAIYFIQEIKDQEKTYDKVLSYGFNMNGEWSKSLFRHYDVISNFFLATEQEVFEALKNEAIKRGFKENVWIKDLGNTQNGNFYYNSKLNYLYCGSYACFQDGTWAEIIETLTKEEAEKKLNVKIID